MEIAVFGAAQRQTHFHRKVERFRILLFWDRNMGKFSPRQNHKIANPQRTSQNSTYFHLIDRTSLNANLQVYLLDTVAVKWSRQEKRHNEH